MTDNISNTGFYDWSYGGNVPMSASAIGDIKDEIESQDMSMQSAVIKDGKLVITVGNKKGDTREISVNIDSVSSKSYTREEADEKFASKTGAPEDMDEMKEVADAIKDIKDVTPYTNEEIDKWLNND